MKKRFLLFGCVMLMACGTATPPAPPVFTGTVTGVTIDTRVFNVRENGSSVLFGIVSGTGDFDQALNWKIESGGVGTLSSNKGSNVIYTAPSSTFGQVVRITASSVQDPTQKKTIYLGVHTNKASIAAGANHSLALKSDGTMLAWGYDFYGQLGDNASYGGPSDNKATPVPVASAASGIVAIAAGAFHSLALKADGTMLAWGYGTFGQLGDGGTLPSTNKPTPSAIPGVTGIVAIAAGNSHSLALKSDGTVLAWGFDNRGQLGDDSSFADKSTPISISGVSGIVAIAAGYYHSIALKSDGTVVSWGSDEFGQLGDGGAIVSTNKQPTPVAVSSAANGVVAIAASFGHSLALKSDGTMLSWGYDSDGQLGDDNLIASKSVPVPVSSASGILAIAVGSTHSLALKSDGTMLSWGSDGNGELGDDGSFTRKLTPVPVSSIASGIVGIAGGDNHSLALKSDGTMLSWGFDGSGELGNDAANTDSPTPVSVLLGTFTIRVP